MRKARQFASLPAFSFAPISLSNLQSASLAYEYSMVALTHFSSTSRSASSRRIFSIFYSYCPSSCSLSFRAEQTSLSF